MEELPELGALFKTLHPMVRAFARRFEPVAPRSVAYEDLVQEGEVAIWRCLGTYRPVEGASFKTYASLRVRGAMLDYMRDQAIGPRGSRMVTESWNVEQFDTLGSSASELDRLLEREFIEEIVAAWQTLPRMEREVVSKYYGDERNLADIARDYGLSPGRISQIRAAAEGKVRSKIRTRS